MENRLPWQRILPLFLLVASSFSFSTFLQAQQFTINFTGSDTLYVGNDCQTILDWGHPNTVSFSAVSGNQIDTFYIESISPNAEIGDTVSAPRIFNIDYFVRDTAGVSEIIQSALRIVIGDSIAPVFDLTTLPNDTTYFNSNNVPLPPSLSTIMASDNCEVENIFYNGETGDRPEDCGSFTRSWTVEDTPGNRTIYVQTITISGDTLAPVWNNNPDTLNLSCNIATDVTATIENWLATNGNATVSDDSDFSVTHDFVSLNGCGLTGDTVVIFTATDACGNNTSVMGNITITDTIKPTITTLPIDTSFSFDNPTLSFDEWIINHGFAEATDFCTIIDNSIDSDDWLVQRIDTTFGCGNSVTYDVRFAIIDACGNLDTASASYALVDSIGTNIAGLFRDTTDACGGETDGLKLEQWFIRLHETVLQDANGNDLDFVAINFTDRDSFSGQWLNIGFPFNDDFIPQNDCNWYLDAEIVFEDDCGRLSRDTARFFLIDTLPPTIGAIPVDTMVLCDQIPPVITNLTGTDNCDTSLAFTVSELRDTTLSAINISRIYIVTDDCNNSDSATQLITVIDTIAPVLAETPTDTTVSYTH